MSEPSSVERLLGRLIGTAWVLVGLVLIAIPVFVEVTEGWGRDSRSIFIILAMTGTGIAFMFVGRYFWRHRPESSSQIRATSRFDETLIAHRHQLEVVGQLGCVLALFNFVSACFGKDWPIRGASLTLLLSSYALDFLARRIANPEVADDRDWTRVPKPVRVILQATQKALNSAYLVVSLAIIWTVLSGAKNDSYALGVRIVASGTAALMFAVESLFFRYGELRPATDQSSE